MKKPTTRGSAADDGIVSGCDSRNVRYADAIAALEPKINAVSKKKISTGTGPANKRKATEQTDDVTPQPHTKKTATNTKTNKDKDNMSSSTTDMSQSDLVIQGMIEMKCWSQKISNDPYAIPSVDGKSVRCRACGMKGRTNGDIKMRRDWNESHWFLSHCETDGHKNNVAVMEAEANDRHIKKYQQKSMINFFSVKKKSSTKQINNEPKQTTSITAAAAAALPESGQSRTVIAVDEDDE